MSLVLVVAFAVVLSAVVLGIGYVVRPWCRTWGATRGEVDAPLPGDELLEPADVTTRAISVDAPVEQVWDWVVELRLGARGWRVEDGPTGAPRREAGSVSVAEDETIVPQLRAVGNGIQMLPGAGFEVRRVEAPRSMVSQGPDGTTWCLQLVDEHAGRCRVVSRFRSRGGPVAFLDERRMLIDLRERAESGAPLRRNRGNGLSPDGSR